MEKRAVYSLEFDDTDSAKLLFGEYGENIAYLEKLTGIELTNIGNRLNLEGSLDICEHVSSNISDIYQKITLYGLVDPIEIRTLIDDKFKSVKKQSQHQNSKNTSCFKDKDTKKTTSNQKLIRTKKTTLFARNVAQNIYIDALQTKTMVFGIGPAGTGKTFLAAAQAVALLESGEVERIILTRPAVEAGERIGFLPGDMKEKVDPYLRPLYDAINIMMPAEKAERAMGSGVIEIAPLAFMRGRTLRDAAIILDEAQNTTCMQMKMFLTRLGEGAKMFITGDTTQIDLPKGEKSGLVDAIKRLDNIDDIIIHKFTNEDVVRHPLVSKIVDAYDK